LSAIVDVELNERERRKKAQRAARLILDAT
jgi:hypothetical protein